jgi:hypothetical protein
VVPLPIFGGVPGDQLIVRVGDAEAITLLRPCPPNYGAVADALAEGRVFPLNPSRRPEDLLRVLADYAGAGPARHPAPSRWRVPGLRHLVRLK